MKSLRVRQLIYSYDESEDGEPTSTYLKTSYLDIDKISSFYIEAEEEVNGEMIKPYFLPCDGIAYSVMPDQHVYKVVYEKFIKNAIKE